MDGAEGDGEGVDAGGLDELLGLLRVGVDLVGGIVVVEAGGGTAAGADGGVEHGAELGLDGDVERVGDLADLLGDGEVLLIGLGGGIDHDGGEAHVHGADQVIEVDAVVEVHADGHLGALGVADHGGADLVEGGEALVLVDLRMLDDDGNVELLCGLDGRLDGLEVGNVERADGIRASHGLVEDFLHGNEHGTLPFSSSECSEEQLTLW